MRLHLAHVEYYEYELRRGEYGLDANLEYVREGRPNVIARIKGDGSGPSLLIGGTLNFEDAGRGLKERLSQVENTIRKDLDPEIRIQVDLQLHRESAETSSDNKLVQAVQKATHEVFGQPRPLTGMRPVGDQSFFVRDADVPAVYYGPSPENTTAHSNNESVSIDSSSLWLGST